MRSWVGIAGGGNEQVVNFAMGFSGFVILRERGSRRSGRSEQSRGSVFLACGFPVRAWLRRLVFITSPCMGRQNESVDRQNVSVGLAGSRAKGGGVVGEQTAGAVRYLFRASGVGTGRRGCGLLRTLGC